MTGSGTRIGWIRHGVTEWNRLGKIQGQTDIPLSKEGIQQAQRLAERLAKEDNVWHGVMSSHLTRTSQTAEIIAEKLGIPVRLDPRLRERSFGAAEGTTQQERLARWGENWRKLVTDQESDEEVLARGSAFLEDFVRGHSGEAWLVVTHGSFLARILRDQCPDLEDSHLQNTSLTILERTDAGWIPLLHNCTAHLLDESADAPA